MSFIQSMEERYTTKMYNSSKKIDITKLEELKNVLRLSPSSINSQPWKFLFISDAETKTLLAKASLFNESKILGCHALVVFSRIDSVEEFEKQIIKELPEGFVGYYNEFVKPLSEEQIKAWFDRQVYLALGVFLSACANMKIDSTTMEGIETYKYDTILGLEGYHSIVAVAIGYRDKDDFNDPSKKTKSRKEFDLVIKSI
ncbi:MAG: NAD(P)H-dependent oxidoreductase [Bacteroidales bacterium]|nr:NAD(P)H-dependent oxidoreductase [Bacteroidales bacterium]